MYQMFLAFLAGSLFFEGSLFESGIYVCIDWQGTFWMETLAAVRLETLISSLIFWNVSFPVGRVILFLVSVLTQSFL